MYLLSKISYACVTVTIPLAFSHTHTLIQTLTQHIHNSHKHNTDTTRTNTTHTFKIKYFTSVVIKLCIKTKKKYHLLYCVAELCIVQVKDTEEMGSYLNMTSAMIISRQIIQLHIIFAFKLFSKCIYGMQLVMFVSCILPTSNCQIGLHFE